MLLKFPRSYSKRQDKIVLQKVQLAYISDATLTLLEQEKVSRS